MCLVATNVKHERQEQCTSYCNSRAWEWVQGQPGLHCNKPQILAQPMACERRHSNLKTQYATERLPNQEQRSSPWFQDPEKPLNGRTLLFCFYDFTSANYLTNWNVSTKMWILCIKDKERWGLGLNGLSNCAVANWQYGLSIWPWRYLCVCSDGLTSKEHGEGDLVSGFSYSQNNSGCCNSHQLHLDAKTDTCWYLRCSSASLTFWVYSGIEDGEKLREWTLRLVTKVNLCQHGWLQNHHRNTSQCFSTRVCLEVKGQIRATPSQARVQIECKGELDPSANCHLSLLSKDAVRPVTSHSHHDAFPAVMDCVPLTCKPSHPLSSSCFLQGVYNE